MFYAQSHTPNVEGKIELNGSYNFSKYESIVKRCESKGVKVAIVLYPCWHTYVENLNKFQLNDTKRMMRELADNHDNCIALDFMSDPRFESSDFHDAIHLNKNGAEKMAGILEDTLFNVL